jgi:hypothetical protein
MRKVTPSSATARATPDMVELTVNSIATSLPRPQSVGSVSVKPVVKFNTPRTPHNTLQKNPDFDMKPSCGKCKAKDVKIYRPYGSFYRPEDNRCNGCLKPKDYDNYIPCCMAKDGSVWGFTSVPEEDCLKFYALPERSSKKPTWLQHHRFVTRQGKKLCPYV